MKEYIFKVNIEGATQQTEVVALDEAQARRRLSACFKGYQSKIIELVSTAEVVVSEKMKKEKLVHSQSVSHKYKAGITVHLKSKYL